MSVVIKLENVSKQYRLGLIGTNTLKGDMQRWWYNLRGLPDPTLMIGQENNLSTLTSTSTSNDFVWALKDINFEVQQGEVLGIIGKNGAGKSTLLKLLSRVTAPTTGIIKAKGRIASLLEVGTGFHPELTGKENIFLNGAILGMTKPEIRSKLDEIVDFAGVEKYIDTPVKRYSSGMYVRLAFAVAAHLDPEILIVDEVLSVGDAEFQKKAIGKMQDVSIKEGRTVLFVSHNMTSVKSLCTNAILLENGSVSYEGDTDSVIKKYLSYSTFGTVNYRKFAPKEMGNENFWIDEAGIRAKDSDFEAPMTEQNELEVFITYTLPLELNDRIDFTLRFKGENGTFIFSSSTGRNPQKLISSGKNKIAFTIPSPFLNQGNYSFDILVVKNNKVAIYLFEDIISFLINPGMRKMGNWMGKSKVFLSPEFPWEKV